MGATFVVLLTWLGGLGFPNYSHLSQYISELGASGAPHESWIRFAGFLPAGLLLWLFAWAAFKALPNSSLASFGLLGIAAYAAGYVAAAFFPCDFGCRPQSPSRAQVVHNFVGLVGYVMAPLAIAALASAARSWPGAHRLPVLGSIAAALSLAGLLTLSPQSPLVGLSQRVIEASVLLWVLACALYVHRQTSGAT
jgi:hypothetical membrane protein